MKKRKYKYFMCDFETTVYPGQEYTEVWAAACVELNSCEVSIFNSIGDLYNYFISLKSHIICYFHNLKFDGSFWISYLLTQLHYNQAIEQIDDEEVRFLNISEMENKTFSYSISSMGQWYRIIIKVNDKIIEIRDSLKLLPFSVKRIGDSFKTKNRKLEIEYSGFRYSGCKIKPSEKEYIRNDVLVVSEALETMFKEGHNRLTIGSCCLHEYKQLIGKTVYERYFPDLYDTPLDNHYGAKNADEYIRKSYHGGWCYLKRSMGNNLLGVGLTADVNSLYPSMMSGESGNSYPIGQPTFWSGNYIPDEARDGQHYYFVRFKCRFYLKQNKLPFIQIKNSFGYRATEMLETSARKNEEDGKYYEQYYDLDGNLKESIVELTMTMSDFRLFVDHYNLKDFYILDGCYFKSAVGVFDPYITKYKQIKLNSTGALKELAKLFLNNLYGKLAASKVSNFKVAYLKEDKTIGYYAVQSEDKIPGYIAAGSAITSYSRCFTIRAAQENYYNFVYADTDSIHCVGTIEDLKGIKIHSKDFCCWKVESCWDFAYFARQKTYIEHVVKEDGQEIKPYYNVKCAGMPEKCKKLFIASLDPLKQPMTKYSYAESEFLSTARNITDFDVGLTIPGKLVATQIRGGTVLKETTYKIR